MQELIKHFSYIHLGLTPILARTVALHQAVWASIGYYFQSLLIAPFGPRTPLMLTIRDLSHNLSHITSMYRHWTEKLNKADDAV